MTSRDVPTCAPPLSAPCYTRWEEASEGLLSRPLRGFVLVGWDECPRHAGQSPAIALNTSQERQLAQHLYCEHRHEEQLTRSSI